jgi:hypothetical protein
VSADVAAELRRRCDLQLRDVNQSRPASNVPTGKNPQKTARRERAGARGLRWYAPVSTGNSLLSGKLTGNSAIWELLEAKSGRKAAVPQRFPGKIPAKINREIIFPNRENSDPNRKLLRENRKQTAGSRHFLGMMPHNISSAIGTKSMTRLSRVDCAPWAFGTSLPHRLHPGRTASPNG